VLSRFAALIAETADWSISIVALCAPTLLRMTLLRYSETSISELGSDGLDGNEAEFDDVPCDNRKDKRDDRARCIAEPLAKRLDEDDREQGSKSKEEAIGDEVAGAFRGCGRGPMEIERMQETTESEEDKEQQSLTENQQNSFHSSGPFWLRSHSS